MLQADNTSRGKGESSYNIFSNLDKKIKLTGRLRGAVAPLYKSSPPFNKKKVIKKSQREAKPLLNN
jgi:hypothetical protein